MKPRPLVLVAAATLCCAALELQLAAARALDDTPAFALEHHHLRRGPAARHGPHAARRLLMERRPGADASLAADPAPEAVVAFAFHFQAEHLLDGLARGGLALTPDAAERQAALDAVAAHARALAAQAIAACRPSLTALERRLRAVLPRRANHATMEALLRDPSFGERLRDARVEARLLATTALEARLPAFAAAVHAALAPLVVAPSTLPPLQDFAAEFLGAFAPAFASSIVDATLVHGLWQD